MIRQGNSGAPFVDELFRVAGVAQEGATQESGNDECLRVEELDKWISTISNRNGTVPQTCTKVPIKNKLWVSPTLSGGLFFNQCRESCA
jgi:hypothetical protein